MTFTVSKQLLLTYEYCKLTTRLLPYMARSSCLLDKVVNLFDQKKQQQYPIIRRIINTRQMSLRDQSSVDSIKYNFEKQHTVDGYCIHVKLIGPFFRLF